MRHNGDIPKGTTICPRWRNSQSPLFGTVGVFQEVDMTCQLLRLLCSVHDELVLNPSMMKLFESEFLVKAQRCVYFETVRSLQYILEERKGRSWMRSANISVESELEGLPGHRSSPSSVLSAGNAFAISLQQKSAMPHHQTNLWVSFQIPDFETFEHQEMDDYSLIHLALFCLYVCKNEAPHNVTLYQ
jgi:hypothetical protein